MRKATDTVLRYLATLRCIPVHPHTKNTRHILQELQKIGSDYDVSVRTVQRNLEELSRMFPISCETQGRANHWYWTDQHTLTQLPSMSAPTAFALRLAADHLESVMPPSTLRVLEPYFNHADTVLEGTALGSWTNKAAIIERGPVLKPPSFSEDVQEAVYTALTGNRKIELAYRSKIKKRAKRIVLNPLGVVVREGVVYLVATSWDYDDIRHYALHRMSKPKLLDEPARETPGFDLASHIWDESQFSYPLSKRKLRLRALFDPVVGAHVTESRLSADHQTTEQEDGRVLVTATVPDTSDLRWWLLSFGSAVEVLEPKSLRLEMQNEALVVGDI